MDGCAGSDSLHRQFRFRSGVGALVREPYCAPGLLFPSGSVIGPAPTTYTPQEIIVGVNSDAQQQVKQLWCVGNKCNPAFRPRFNEPRLVQRRPFVVGTAPTLPGAPVRLLLGKETGVSSCRDSFSSTASPQLNTRQNGNRKTFLLHFLLYITAICPGLRFGIDSHPAFVTPSENLYRLTTMATQRGEAVDTS